MRFTRDESLMLFTSISWMNSYGFSIPKTIEKLRDDKASKVNKANCNKLLDSIYDGKSFWQSMKDNCKLFSDRNLWRQFQVAETTGKLSECCDRICKQLKQNSEFERQIRKASVQPILTLILLVAVSYYVITEVMPTYTETFHTFGSELPELTLALIAFGELVQTRGILVGIVAVASIVFFLWLINNPLKWYYHKIILSIPTIKQVSININYSTAYVLICDMLAYGTHPAEAIKIAAMAVKNICIRKELLDAADMIEREGVSLAESLSRAKTMPYNDRLLLNMGSETGRELELLAELPIKRKAEADDFLESLSDSLPVLMSVPMTIVIGIVVMALFLPTVAIMEVI